MIIAYLTSAACPHGAYLLKKQNNYESSLVGKTVRSTAGASARRRQDRRGAEQIDGEGNEDDIAPQASAYESAQLPTERLVRADQTAKRTGDRRSFCSQVIRPRRVDRADTRCKQSITAV